MILMSNLHDTKNSYMLTNIKVLVNKTFRITRTHNAITYEKAMASAWPAAFSTVAAICHVEVLILFTFIMCDIIFKLLKIDLLKIDLLSAT